MRGTLGANLQPPSDTSITFTSEVTMMQLRAIAVLVGVVMLQVACGGSRSGPTSPSVLTSTTTTASPPPATSVRTDATTFVRELRIESVVVPEPPKVARASLA